MVTSLDIVRDFNKHELFHALIHIRVSKKDLSVKTLRCPRTAQLFRALPRHQNEKIKILNI